jgi:hypothetical protein
LIFRRRETRTLFLGPALWGHEVKYRVEAAQ